MRGKKRTRRVKKVKKLRRKVQRFEDGYLDTYKEEIKKLTRQAMSGKLDEEGRAEVASQIALVKAAKTYSMTLKDCLKKFNTNLGLLIKTNTIYPVSLILEGTGDEGANEYIPLRVCSIIGEIESLEEHVETLRRNHDEALDCVEEGGRFNPSLERQIMPQPPMQQ